MNTSGTTASETGDRALLGWVWSTYLRPHRWLFLVAIVLMALQGAMLGALSKLIEPMFDQVFIAGDRAAVVWVGLAIAGTFFVRAGASFGQRTILNWIGLDVVAGMQRDMTNHLMTLDSAFFQGNPVGKLIERVRGDTTLANQIWSNILSIGVREVITLVVLIGVAISIDPIWTAIAVAGIPLLLVPIYILQNYVRKKTRTAREAAEGLSTRLDEMFHGIDTIKLNTAENRESARFDATVDHYVKQEFKSRIGQAAIPPMTDIVAGISFFGVLYYGGLQIIDGDKTVGEFMSFFTALGLIFEPLRQLTRVFAAWQAARASLERIHDLLQVPAFIVSPATPVAPPQDGKTADIVFDDVVVQYGREPALTGASFVAEAGQTTALVGASGAGKSTVFNVMSRLVDPTSGVVTIGGVATTDMVLAELRAMYSVVTQDAPMFDESLRDNIVLNTANVSASALEQAIEAAHLREFIDSLPNGLGTRAGPRGSALSGGQRQRVAIARAIIRDAPILLLDEATSALDVESEVRVQEALDRLARDRTTLVIAHRLSTIRQADQIIVMDKGAVLDRGRHEELLERGGHYAHLHALQFSA